MLNLVAKVNSLGIPLVVTCHTVMEPPSPKGWFFLKSLSQVSAVIAHNEEMKHALARWKIPEKNLCVIPHGTPEDCKLKEKTVARRELYLPEDSNIVIAISLGFISPGKMQHEAVEAIISLVNDGLLDPSRFLYVIAGSPGQGDATNIEYCRQLHEKIHTEKAWNYIRIIPDFVPVKKLPVWYGASDFVITGSHPTFFSVSGRSHQEMAYKMPSISSTAHLLSDLNEMRSLKYDSIFQLRAHILRMAGDPGLRKILSNRCASFAKDTSWTNVARSHIKLYEKLLARKRKTR
jgi:glycosyltransferase involved in cell wall biosynthesis